MEKRISKKPNRFSIWFVFPDLSIVCCISSDLSGNTEQGSLVKYSDVNAPIENVLIINTMHYCKNHTLWQYNQPRGRSLTEEPCHVPTWAKAVQNITASSFIVASTPDVSVVWPCDSCMTISLIWSLMTVTFIRHQWDCHPLIRYWRRRFFNDYAGFPHMNRQADGTSHDRMNSSISKSKLWVHF